MQCRRGNMLRFHWSALFALSIFHDLSYGNERNITAENAQEALNKFCQNSNLPFCHGKPTIYTSTGNSPSSIPTATPEPTNQRTDGTTTTIPLVSNSGHPTVSASCQYGGKRCPGLRSKCVPTDIDCNVINSNITCRIPNAYGLTTRILVCGDDTNIGERCRDGDLVPVLTSILVQCSSNNDIPPRPIVALDVLNGPGDEGGAGVYQCSPNEDWKPIGDSPYLTQLSSSCRDVGCGFVPQPREDMPVHRRWAWVRAIFKDNLLHCTATLVSPEAAVTAAHCLTSSIVSNQPDPDLSKYALELPAPTSNGNFKKILVTPRSVHIHPKYTYNDGYLQYDMAIIFFDWSTSTLPMVCIGKLRRPPPDLNQQIVFSLNLGQADVFHPGNLPSWKYTSANWDRTCLATSTRNSGDCSDALPIQRSQFCANHAGTSMTRGSSGGPYLVEVGKSLKELWVIAGVLSFFSNDSSCSRDHSVYENVAYASKWMKECVYEKQCD